MNCPSEDFDVSPRSQELKTCPCGTKDVIPSYTWAKKFKSSMGYETPPH